MLITDSNLAQLGNRSAASMQGVGRRDLNIDAEETVPVGALVGPSLADVARTVAGLLHRKWQL